MTYLTWEDTGGNGVNADLSTGKCSRQHTAQMSSRRLRTGVRKLAVAATLHVPGDTADIDDRRSVTGRNVLALGQQRQEGHAHPKDAADIGLEGVGPALRRRLQEVLGD